MRSLLIETRIAAPAERVFALSADIPAFSDVVAGIERIEMLTEGPVGPGTRWRETRVMYGKSQTEEMEITGFDPPHRIRIEADTHGAHYVSTYRFTPQTGGTRVELEFAARPMTLVARVMSAILWRVMAPSLGRMLESDLRDLKRAAESRGA